MWLLWPIRGLYPGHVNTLDQWEAAFVLTLVIIPFRLCLGDIRERWRWCWGGGWTGDSPTSMLEQKSVIKEIHRFSKCQSVCYENVKTPIFLLAMRQINLLWRKRGEYWRLTPQLQAAAADLRSGEKRRKMFRGVKLCKEKQNVFLFMNLNYLRYH